MNEQQSEQQPQLNAKELILRKGNEAQARARAFEERHERGEQLSDEEVAEWESANDELESALEEGRRYLATRPRPLRRAPAREKTRRKKRRR